MTADLFGEDQISPLHHTPARKLKADVSAVMQTPQADDFQTRKVSGLTLTLEGIPGDRHGGYTRCSGGREPYYPRGTEMCNERQVSILSEEELRSIARRMDVRAVEAEWIGGNILVKGLANLSLIPPRTRLVFEGGAVIRVDGDNRPCRYAGKAIAANYPDRDGLDLLFPKVAQRLRGLVGFVEKPGTIRAGESVTAHVPEQWIYQPG
ncbi:MOSC domain-containing protein [Roseibium sp. RKSG952]|uniref:MOSC domain-containing protein n=1 Tax=Roseibium sp. RKSG952 TaxID=2529384 RepID=UPI0012BCBD90|nr:MOSC domain-containing protein [Roseibium sp. RKSG952]MTH97670.1 MOSC domain-containing protein [Roseibium sp. RKSG952]